MNSSSRNSFLLGALASFSLLAGTAQAQITNGDFETGDFTGWDLTGNGHTVSNASPLDGTWSFVQTDPVTGNAGAVSQSFTPFTSVATTSFIFNATDPGGAGDRGLSVTFGHDVDDSQINLRLVDADADGDGDIQAFSGTWNTVLADAVTFGSTTTFELKINGYGGSFSYDLNVGGNIVSGLTALQNSGSSTLSNFSEIAFVGSQFSPTASVTIDNISVVPEPSSFALLLGSVCVMTLLRRRRQ